ncbi:hypothetical protein C8R44DRAFT_70268 [Mycena epipterygia]|nr:hypothetical protein C8R44DRAFT_70268 [Mycena epipterygia]
MRECDGCENEIKPASAVPCPGCTTKLYCSQWCLEDSADYHVRRCGNPRRPLTTADTLTTAAFADMFPDDPQTNEDYFFTRLRSPHDKTHLFGLYIGILKIHGVKPSKLHEWRISGKMIENIKALYEDLPARNRGGYYTWFLKHLEVFEPRPSALVTVAPRHLCASCGVSARVRCSACKKVWYCSKECQQKEWPGHLVDCNPGRPITSADRLRAAVHRQTVPEDFETLSDYGFSRVDEMGGKILLNVYASVFEEGVRSRDLQKWKTSGILLEEVEKLLKRLEMWKTYQFMRWFEAHRYAFDPTMPAAEEGGQFALILQAARVKLWNDVGDFPSQNIDEIDCVIRDHWSEERTAFFLFRSMLEMCHPAPQLDSWVCFGFCACHDEAEEGFLNLTYKILSERCSYDEFFTAYNTSKIIELLDANGLRGRRIVHPYLEDALSGSPRMFKSVWYLKQHAQDTTSVRSNLTPSVNVDYGFMNCTSESEYQDLKEMYKGIFERSDANPLKLHEACISGTLYEYVLGVFPELKTKKNRAKKFKRLLRNLYPLPNI